MYEIEYEMFRDLISKNPSVFDGKALIFISQSANQNTELEKLTYHCSMDMVGALKSIEEAHLKNIRSTGCKLLVQINEQKA